ncbi:MAG TPA: ComF family protein [Patescibacteria group bacterium]|nr:ComF family protein [Patescibacteria group bacterium]
MKQILNSAWHAFKEILAPRHCEICERYIGEIGHRFEFICDQCADSLEPGLPPDELFNRFVKVFKSDEIAISWAFGLYSFSEETPVSKLIYALKYRGASRIGIEFGRELGEVLKTFKKDNYDALLPVPIHHARQRERGYNQSEMLAEGISGVLKIPVRVDVAKRTRYTLSQTTLSAEERFKNVADVFKIVKPHEIFDKKILLIDDIFTTGATLNACASVLLENGAREIHTAVLAVAK